MARRKWNELSARTRRLVVAGAVVEGALKVAALVVTQAAGRRGRHTS